MQRWCPHLVLSTTQRYSVYCQNIPIYVRGIRNKRRLIFAVMKQTPMCCWHFFNKHLPKEEGGGQNHFSTKKKKKRHCFLFELGLCVCVFFLFCLWFYNTYCQKGMWNLKWKQPFCMKSHQIRCSHPSATSLSGTNSPFFFFPRIAPCVLIPKPSTHSTEPPLSQHNHGHKKRGHYITGHIPNCADRAHNPFPLIAKIVSAYFSQ